MRNRRVLILSAIVVAACTRGINAQSELWTVVPSGTAIACAPSVPLGPQPADRLRIVGGQDPTLRSLFGPRELVVVNGGTQAGVQLDQEYFVRRLHRFGRASESQTVHTSGRLRIVAVNDTTAVAQLTATCDGVLAGDFLEPFVAPAEPGESAAPGATATLDFSSLGRIMFGDEQRHLGGPGDLMLLEYGTAVAAGTRVALYRDLRAPGLPLTAVGEGVIVSVDNGTPLLRITAARDAIVGGDYVVPRR